MEAVLKREILDLGYEISQVEDGRVTFLGIWAVAPASIFLRTTERILIKVGKSMETFDELFEGTKGTSLGGLHSRRRKILGGKGEFH